MSSHNGRCLTHVRRVISYLVLTLEGLVCEKLACLFNAKYTVCLNDWRDRFLICGSSSSFPCSILLHSNRQRSVGFLDAAVALCMQAYWNILIEYPYRMSLSNIPIAYPYRISL